VAKVYLKAGDKINVLTVDARVGMTGTVVDISIDWSADGIKKVSGTDGVGHVVRSDIEGYNGEAYCFGVHVEDETGKLWFDTEMGE